MDEQQIEYLKELIEYFIERQNIDEAYIGEVHFYLSFIYSNASFLKEEDYSLLINLFITLNPNKVFSEKDVDALFVIVNNLKQFQEEVSLPDVEYLQDEGNERIYLSRNKQNYKIKQKGSKVKIVDLMTNKFLIEGGTKLLFRKW